MMVDTFTIKGRCAEAVRKNDASDVRQCFSLCPSLHSDRTYLRLAIGEAVADDNLEMAKLLVEMGASIDAPIDDDGDEGLILQAAIWNALRIARWLLEQGVPLNHEWEGVTRCLSLSMAASHGCLEIVKLLVEHGANINATWQGYNPLVEAMEAGQTEVVSYLRSKGAKTPEELGLLTVPDVPCDDAFVAHLSAFLGTPDRLALREIVPTDLPIAIHVIRTEDEQILVTEGMSARPMTVPAGGEAFQFAELVLRLPSDWPLTLAAFENPQTRVVAGLLTEPRLVDRRSPRSDGKSSSLSNDAIPGDLRSSEVARSGDRPQQTPQQNQLPDEHYWPIEWLKRIARYPHDNETWLGGPHTIIANGEPPEPFAPNTKMSCLMLLANPSEFGRWTRPSDGAEVVFYDVFGLYTEERDLELREGLPALLNRFQDRFISNVLDPQRPNVALPSSEM